MSYKLTIKQQRIAVKMLALATSAMFGRVISDKEVLKVLKSKNT